MKQLFKALGGAWFINTSFYSSYLSFTIIHYYSGNERNWIIESIHTIKSVYFLSQLLNLLGLQGHPHPPGLIPHSHALCQAGILEFDYIAAAEQKLGFSDQFVFILIGNFSFEFPILIDHKIQRIHAHGTTESDQYAANHSAYF